MSPLLALIVGLVALIAGGELLVRGTVAAATRLGVSPMIIGVTLVGFGTSTPELVTSIQAALDGVPGIAVGNVIGSNIANVLLILGVAAVLAPVAVKPNAVRRDTWVMLATGAAAALALLGLGGIGRAVGVVFVIALAVYIVWTYRLDKRDGASAELHAQEAAQVPATGMALPVALVTAVAGLGLTLLGAGWLVDGAVWMARAAGVSEGVIGLTVVAVGTSLPELTAAVVAALRGHSDVAFGNVVGSNIYNVLGILGVTGLVTPLALPADIAWTDLGLMIAASAALLPVALSGRRISRPEGAAFLALYAGYIGYLTL
ncbi:sodium:calcium antiporter [Rhodovibrio sodomensis]|uniref:Sodium:calcium antiporter n=1 Tax=Rhodovibrio sodomensis TaxID=1088 RepID=A0ABS1DD58_9PROT|nr:calcium/sodium antiporter [Rhodovibrio sodomensis]MBK1668057.1 sodium:calcium antiporter [Rhodovibrio sodomensis]